MPIYVLHDYMTYICVGQLLSWYIKNFYKLVIIFKINLNLRVLNEVKMKYFQLKWKSDMKPPLELLQITIQKHLHY